MKLLQTYRNLYIFIEAVIEKSLKAFTGSLSKVLEMEMFLCVDMKRALTSYQIV